MHKRGFTLVELLIVIVVIAILAAISIVAYVGVADRATNSRIQSMVQQVDGKIRYYAVDNGSYPASLADINIASDNQLLYQYSNLGNDYCLTATIGTSSYFVSKNNNTPQPGVCLGQNMLMWNKIDSSLSTVKLGSCVSIDTSTYHTQTSSIKMSPNCANQALRGNNYPVAQGQVYQVTLYIKTDSTWDGTSNNSKIRYGDGATGNPLTVCSYNGVKTSWTLITCNYTVPSGITSLTMSVGNDGTTGNIWIDDLNFARTS